jgi:hypothetical protein
MNPLLKALNQKIAIRRAQAHLSELKKTMSTTTPSSLITVTNSAGEIRVPVTSRDQSGKVSTKNLSVEQALAYSKQVTRPTSKAAPKPPPAVTRPAASATPKPAAAAPKAAPASTVAFQPTPVLAPMTRSEFNSLTAADKCRFASAGGRLTN